MEETPALTHNTLWSRVPENPVFRDPIANEDYESASDGHVFYDEEGEMWMIYSGDVAGLSSIKLAKANSLTDWEPVAPLLYEANEDLSDLSKETSFYRRTQAGTHQIYYIGYEDGATYQSQIFLAESDELEGPYTALPAPVVPRGLMAGKDVYLITSPSVVEYDDMLYMTFIGWNDAPELVTEVWMMGATSTDDGHSWSDFQIVDTPIGMEGQVTMRPDGGFVAVRTGDHQGEEALYYASADHPFGPYSGSDTPILVKDGSGLELDEIIAPQISYDPQSGEEYLFYTGADHQIGWWMMLAIKE